MSAGIGLAYYDRRMLKNFTHRLGISLGVNMDKAGLEIFFERQVQETIQTVFSQHFGNFFHRLPLKRLIFRELDVIDENNIPPSWKNRRRSVLDRFRSQFFSHIRIGEHLSACLHRVKHSRLPRREFIETLRVEYSAPILKARALRH